MLIGMQGSAPEQPSSAIKMSEGSESDKLGEKFTMGYLCTLNGLANCRIMMRR